MRQGAADAAPEGRGDADPPVTEARAADDPAAEQPWAYDKFTVADELPAADVAANLAGGLARSPDIGAAVRRRVRMWVALGIIGLLLGIGLHTVHPPAHKASTSVFLAYGAGADASDAVLTEIALVQSQPVAEQAIRQLGLRQSVSSFQATYTATDPTNQLLQITVSSRSSDAAVREANAVASTFLHVQAAELRTQQRLFAKTLDQQLSAARQQVQAINAQITTVNAQPASAARRTKLADLQAARQQANAALTGLEQAAASSQVNGQTNTAAVVDGSRVLDAAAATPLSKMRSPVAYAIAGLIAGLVVGLGIVVIQALVSNRLRRRDDIAAALGASVGLSVGRIRTGRRFGHGGMDAAQDREMRKVVAYLHGAVADHSHRAALAIVPVDPESTWAAAVAVVSLALSCVKQGRKVMLADLSDGQAAARLLGVGGRGPGVGMVNMDGAQLVLAVPDDDDIMPTGPVGQGRPHGRPDHGLAEAHASADLSLALVTLDPSHGSEYLATWATEVVAMVTAGGPSTTRIKAVGELIRLADTPLVSAILIGADKTDESLGVFRAPEADSGAGAAAEGSALADHLGPAEGGLIVAADG